ncbi:MAG: rhomboid family intramembrane serine protease [Planctomycetes bacterium]|nr:rhomboid family intramembrane serine protease [Planctomycetota bacterium]
MIRCPYCGTEVTPTAEGFCPVCRSPLHGGAREDAAAHRRSMVEFRTALFAQTPRVFITPLIVAINVLVFLAMATSGVDPIRPTALEVLPWGANFGPKTLGGEWWRLGASMFLHFGLIHLGFNMWVLWDAGKLVERLVGNVGFLILYLFSGLMAAVVSLNWHPQSVGAGASGAVFGVIGALGGFLLLRRDTVPMQILQSIRSSLGAFIIFNLFIGLAIPFIDLSAHVGGLIAGGVCGLVMSRPITLENTGGRVVRNLAVLVIAVIAILVGLSLLPAPPDLEAEAVLTPKALHKTQPGVAQRIPGTPAST